MELLEETKRNTIDVQSFDVRAQDVFDLQVLSMHGLKKDIAGLIGVMRSILPKPATPASALLAEYAAKRRP